MKDSSSRFFIIFMSLFFVVLLLSTFVYQQFKLERLEQKTGITLAPTATPLPTATPTPVDTTGWKTYKNSLYGYQFSCPKSSLHKVEVNQTKNSALPLYQEICHQGPNEVRVFVIPASTADYQVEPGVWLKNFINPDSRSKIVIRGFDQLYFDQILSTFKFTN